MNNTKIFVTGTARGGTTVISRMLSANKDINIAISQFLEILRLQRNIVLNKFDKKKYSFKNTSKLPFQDYYYSDESIKILDLIVNSSTNLHLPKKIWLQHLGIIKKRLLISNKDLVKNIDKAYHSNFTKLINNCFNLIKKSRNLNHKKMIGFLDSWYIEMFLPLAKSFKNSKFIVIIRDPRASIASHTNIKKKRNIGNILSFIKSWRKMIALTIYFKSLKIFKNRLCVVTHEDLIKNPQRICKKLCDFLNVKFKKEMLDTTKYIDHSSGEVWKGNSTFEKETFGFSKKRTQRWKKILNNSQIKAIEFIAHHELKLLGYKFFKKDNFYELKSGLSLLIQDDKKKKKWALEGNKTEINYGIEFFRNYLFDINSVGKDKKILRRLFLYQEVYNQIKNKRFKFS